MRRVLAPILGTVAACCAVAASAQPPKFPDPPAEIAVFTLPEGELQPISMGDKAVFFIIAEHTRKQGQKVQARVYEVHEPGIETDYGVAVKGVVGVEADCKNRTWSELGSIYYDAGGKLLMWLDPDPDMPIGEDSAKDFISRVLCDGLRPDLPNVIGHEAARAFAIAAIKAG